MHMLTYRRESGGGTSFQELEKQDVSTVALQGLGGALSKALLCSAERVFQGWTPRACAKQDSEAQCIHGRSWKEVPSPGSREPPTPPLLRSQRIAYN